MISFSWRHWLKSSTTFLTTSQLRKPRKPRVLFAAPHASLEGLESRVLLTANLPVAVNDVSYATNQGQQLIGTSVLSNDTDADGDVIDQAILQNNVQNGLLVLNLNGTFTYTPNASFHGVDSFTYFAADSTHNEVSAAPATVTITVQDINVAPVANAASIETVQNTAKTGTLTASDADGDPLAYFAGQTVPQHGTVTINPNGSFTYTPTTGYVGSDEFTFFASDGQVPSAEATVQVTVKIPNVAPVANAAGLATSEDTPQGGTLTATDANGDPLTYAAGQVAPLHGLVAINADGTFTYTPAANYHGTDSFSFVAHDGTVNSADATITVTVTPVNDAPVANAASINIIQDVAFNGTLTGSDVDGDTLTFAAGPLAPQHGSVVLSANGGYTYTPTAGYTGPDSFSFVANDGTIDSAAAVVSITVASNSAAVVANSASFTILEDTPQTGTLTATAPSGSTLTFLAGQFAPAHGNVIINANGTYTYTPNANANGSDSFTFYVSNGTVNSAEATVSVTVTPVNDAPVANPASIQSNADTPFNGTLTASDVDGNSLTFSAGQTVPAHGTVSISPGGTFTYTPSAGFVGSDSFSFMVNDGAVNSAEATVSVTVNSFNHPPVAVAATVMTQEDNLVGGPLLGTDQDGDPLKFFAGAIAPVHGTVLIAPNGYFIYSPNANFNGTDSFSFYVSDGTLNSPAVTVMLSIAAVNDVPVANPATITAISGVAQSGQLTGSDDDNNALSFAAGATSPAHGTVTINPNGTYVYTPTAGYVGPDSFTFKSNDGTVDSPEATVSVTVKSANRAPVVTNGNGNLNQNTALSGTLATLGTDADGNPLTYAVVVQPTHGTLTLDPAGTFTYTPTTGYHGIDVFTFKANDGQDDSNTGTFNLTIQAVNMPLTLTLPSPSPSVSRNSIPVRIDPQATVSDPDTVVNYRNAQIAAVITNLPSTDATNGRVLLKIQTQGSGPGQIRVRGSKIYFNGSSLPVASFSGATRGRPLVINFTTLATEQAVNAVLKLLTVTAAKRALPGSLNVDIQVFADGQTARASKTLIVG